MYENSTLYSHFCSFSPANVTIENSNFSETGKASGELGTSEVSSSLSLSTAEKRTVILSNVLLLFC